MSSGPWKRETDRAGEPHAWWQHLGGRLLTILVAVPAFLLVRFVADRAFDYDGDVVLFVAAAVALPLILVLEARLERRWRRRR